LTMLDKFGMHIDKLYDGPGTLGEL
jgi:hypothetical protein